MVATKVLKEQAQKNEKGDQLIDSVDSLPADDVRRCLKNVGRKEERACVPDSV